MSSTSPDERTLVLIKPDAVRRGLVGEIISRFERKGLRIDAMASRTMDTVLDETLAPQRFGTLLFGVFAGVALVLASVGIYSVLSHLVRGRTREIGIRTALGASTAAVLRMVVVEGMTPALAGIAAGSVIAVIASTWLERLVFGVSAADPLTLVAVGGTLALVALVASVAPAYRAARLDPLNVLRA